MSVTDYGSEIWWRGQVGFAKTIQGLQNVALRRILGAYRTTPIKAMEVEAALYPAKLRLDNNLQRYAFRALKLPEIHPVKEAFKSGAATRPPCARQSPRRRKTQKKQTQVERILGTMDRFGEAITSLEKIEHFCFVPWDAPPFQVTISNLSKEEEATAHESEEVFDDSIRIYSDSSSNAKDNKGIGVGVICLNPTSPAPPQMFNLGIRQLVYNGELEGLTRGIELASSIAIEGSKFKVFSDSQAALLRLQILEAVQAQTFLLDQDSQKNKKKGSQRAVPTQIRSWSLQQLSGPIRTRPYTELPLRETARPEPPPAKLPSFHRRTPSHQEKVESPAVSSTSP